jgi:hypothetical protein
VQRGAVQRSHSREHGAPPGHGAVAGVMGVSHGVAHKGPVVNTPYYGPPSARLDGECLHPSSTPRGRPVSREGSSLGDLAIAGAWTACCPRSLSPSISTTSSMQFLGRSVKMGLPSVDLATTGSTFAATSPRASSPVPWLAQSYQAPSSSSATRASSPVVVQAPQFHNAPMLRQQPALQRQIQVDVSHLGVPVKPQSVASAPNCASQLPPSQPLCRAPFVREQRFSCPSCCV